MQSGKPESYQAQNRFDTAVLPGAGFVMVGFLTLLALIVVTERVGLPQTVAETAIFLLMFVLCACLACMGRTAEERIFTGRSSLMRPILAGVTAGAVLTGIGVAMLRPVTSDQLAAILMGQAIGLVVAHGLARWSWRRMEGSEASVKMSNPHIAALSGLLQVVTGCMLGLICLSLVAGDLMAALVARGSTLSLLSICLLIMVLPALAVVSGGLRASLVLILGIASLAIAGYGVLLATGLISLGALPLPLFSEANTLAAIVDAKARWFFAPVHPVVLTQWPGLSSAFSEATAIPLLGSAAISCFVMLTLSPALPLRRRSIVLPAVASGIILPLCMVAAGGYAIEAAGLQFVGASVQRPPSGLLEASRNGFVTLCNAAPLTVDALRAACGVSPRDAMLLDWQQVQINRSFLSGGSLAAMGYPVAPGVLARAAESLLLLAGLTTVFWIAARGLGLGVLARDRMAPGLASLRLGFVRLAALLLAAGLVVGVTQLSLPAELLWQIAASAAGLGVALSVIVSIMAVNVPKETITQPSPKPARSGRKTALSADGETA